MLARVAGPIPAESNVAHYFAGVLARDATSAFSAILGRTARLDLAGLFGPVGLTQLFPVPAACLREVIEALNDKALARAWGDDMTLGWVLSVPERPGAGGAGCEIWGRQE